MRWRLRYVGGVAVAAGVVAAVSHARPGHRSIPATSATRTSPHLPTPASGPSRALDARTTVTVDGSVIHRGDTPLIVKVGGHVRLDVTVTPKTGIQVSNLYLGIAGPGNWGDQGSAPTGDYAILLHDATPFTSDRHVTVTWNPVAAQIGSVHLIVFYTAIDNTGPSLIETLLVSFRVSGHSQADNLVV